MPIKEKIGESYFPGCTSGKEMPTNAGDIRGVGSVSGWEDPLEEGMGNDSSILAWKTPRAEEPGGL